MWNTLKKSLNSPDSYVSLALGFAVVLVVGMIAFNYFKARTQQAASTQKETEQASTKLPAKHVVKAGETLWSISEAYYKSGYNWMDIQKANNLTNANTLEAGTELTISEVKPATTSTDTVATTPTPPTEKRQYTVVKGDNLWKIAVAQYQDGYRWSEIARANNLKNPNIIHAGNVLILP